MSKANAKILRNAASVLEERGHAKGVLGDRKTGGVCLLGAIHVAVTGEPWWPSNASDLHRSTELLGIVSKHLCRKLKTNFDEREAVRWNNARKTKAAEVVALLNSAAKSEARRAA